MLACVDVCAEAGPAHSAIAARHGRKKIDARPTIALMGSTLLILSRLTKAHDCGPDEQLARMQSTGNVRFDSSSPSRSHRFEYSSEQAKYLVVLSSQKLLGVCPGMEDEVHSTRCKQSRCLSAGLDTALFDTHLTWQRCSLLTLLMFSRGSLTSGDDDRVVHTVALLAGRDEARLLDRAIRPDEPRNPLAGAE